jgi:Flp pilus assembly pilin Flp
VTALRSRGFLGRTDGAAAIEFALIAPLLMLLFAGMVNLGFQFREEARLNQVTRETAEASRFTQDLPLLRQTLALAIADLGPSIGGQPYSGSVDLLCICPGQNDIPACSPTQAASCPATGLPWGIVIEIRAQMDYRPLIPLIGSGSVLESTMQIQVR